MAKIMLVEDDTNLSEIYRARLEAEGYEIISAGDGEAALAMAVKEKPDLIISDVMMPKISGFEMLDILRGTPGVQNTKVIMMTALSQADDKARASALGADRYLVKSQVTLEDVVTAAKDVLSGTNASPANPTPTAAVPPTPTATPTVDVPASPPQIQPTPAAPTPGPVPDPTPAPTIPAVEPPTETPAPAPTPATSEPAPASPDAPKPATSNPELAISPELAQSLASEEFAVGKQIQDFINQPAATAAPTPAITAPGPTALPPSSNTPEPAPPAIPAIQPAVSATDTATSPSPQAASPDGVSIPGKKIIQPLNDMHTKPDFDLLLAKEAQKEVETGAAQPIINGQPAASPPPTTGYLGVSSPQVGQSNPNNGSEFTDPGSVSL